MKELSIEEKARRYDETIERANSLLSPNQLGNAWIYKLLPELKEESDDERIRKAIRYAIGQSTHSDGTLINGVSSEEALAWLEKQGKQETDEWKEGNIIRHGGILALVIKGRRAMKSNGELFTIQYPNEWVKAVPYEIERFLNELEKQSKKPNPYSGTSFEYNGHIWGMCARDNGVDILLDKQLLKHLEKQGGNSMGISEATKQKLEDNLHEALEKETSESLNKFLDGQGENPTDKVEPKFRVGDIISDGISEVKIVSIGKDNYTVTNDEIENDAHVGNWVVYFKDQDNWKLVEQKSSWSEEDEREVAVLEAYIRTKDWSERHIDRALGIVDELVNKVKFLRPQI